MNISYEQEKWIQSKWRKGTRFYRLELCQNIRANRVVRKAWGSEVLKDFGKSLDTEYPARPRRGFAEREAGLKVYGKLERLDLSEGTRKSNRPLTR